MPSANPTVIDNLQTSVSLHLTAIENYQTQSAHMRRWGYPKLADKFAADVEEERGHLAAVMGRLEFYDVQPTFEHSAPSWPREDYLGILNANLSLEYGAAEAERQFVVNARAAGDELSARVFASLLEGSEASVEEIDAAQRVIRQIGLDNYLAAMI